jgi:hypothetical protein
MDISFETTPGGAAAVIAATPVDAATAVVAVTVDDPRLVALRAAAAVLLPAAGLADTDTVEVSLAMSDGPGWAVIRVAQVIREP